MSTISIALCTYNGEKYLAEQLLSFSGQSRLPDELVACDDGSTDSTRDILTKFAADAPFKVKLEFNVTNLGLVKNFEKAISLCRGEIICLSDQDDVWKPAKLEEVEKAFAVSDDIGLVYTNAEVVNEHLAKTGFSMWDCIGFDEQKQEAFRRGDGLSYLLRDGYVLGSSMAFRSRFRSLYLPIPLDIYFVHDNWIALAVCAVSKSSIVEDPMSEYRQHGDQSSSGMKLVGEMPAIERLNKSLKRNQFEGTVRQLTILAARVSASGPSSLTSLSSIEMARDHFIRRRGLPRNIWTRFITVGRDYFSGSYGSYSNGLRSAMKDIYGGL